MAKEILAKDLPQIEKVVRKVIGVDKYKHICRMGGLTNHTYQVTTEKGEYIIRIPGEGTEELICREDEKISTELACKINIDAELLYFGEDGTKVTRYIPNAETMSPETMKKEENIRQVAEIFGKLHKCGYNTGVPFEVFDMASNYEKILKNNQVEIYEDYEDVKQIVMNIKQKVDSCYKAPLVPCHNDPLCENWIRGGERLYLIDWEYAGMNDGMWDLADVSIEAGYSDEEDEILLQNYLGQKVTVVDKMRFGANKIYLDYLWTLWGKTRVPYDGDVMERYAHNRYIRLKKNIQKFLEMAGE